MTYVFLAYAILSFLWFTGHAPKGQQQGDDVIAHGFCGYWTAFYSAGLAMLTTARRYGLSNLQRTCPFGHDVGWTDKFCPTCGASVAPQNPA